MKVKELIDLLKLRDPEMRVCIDGYEGGYEDIFEKSLTEEFLKIDEHKDFDVYGPHAWCLNKEKADETALVINR